MSELGNPFLEKIRSQQLKKKQKINVKMPHVKKTTNQKWKSGSNKKLGPE